MTSRYKPSYYPRNRCDSVACPQWLVSTGPVVGLRAPNSKSGQDIMTSVFQVLSSFFHSSQRLTMLVSNTLCNVCHYKIIQVFFFDCKYNTPSFAAIHCFSKYFVSVYAEEQALP